jgi:NAD(P)-dependent dehydrogenase (short-subunit alcohol dehydrogenase family)
LDDELRFDGRVAVVSGAGRGLGRAHALELARRGASVVVNDLGSGLDGAGASADPGSSVALEIEQLGGTAVANASSVIPPEGGNEIVQTALDRFGRLDILVNNAGVLDTADFLDASDEHIDRTLDTHLRGAFSVTRPALRVMLEQGYGRIVNTSSAAVLGSPVGLAYQAGKSAMIAFTRALALIGADHDVRANAILPTAFTRMTDTIPDPEFHSFMERRFRPEAVAPVVAALAHESVATSGECFLAGGGRVARLFLGVSDGVVSDDLTAEEAATALGRVMDAKDFTIPPDRAAEFASYLPQLGFDFSQATALTKQGDK